MKKLLYLLTLGGLCLIILVMTKTYALFENNGEAKITESIGKWQIKLNGTDISQSITSDFVIDNFIYTDNTNVANGVIAPGRNGYFDIIVDPSGTDVAVRYDITIRLTANTYSGNVSFNIDDQTGGNAVKTSSDTYSGVISLADIKANKTITLRVNMTWLDETNHDIDDTTLGTTLNSGLEIPVTVIVSQYLGEVITPYQ